MKRQVHSCSSMGIVNPPSGTAVGRLVVVKVRDSMSVAQGFN
jgi:hypothetical protein